MEKEILDSITCQTETYETVIPVEEFLRDCVDIDYFLSLCRKCPNFDKIWSCPSYDFDVAEYWKRYRHLKIMATKVLIPEEIRSRTWTDEESMELYRKILWPVKLQLTQELYRMEEEIPGSVHLSAGSCQLCGEGNCTRPKGETCRFPEKMRYSIESLGGNVTKAAEYLGQTLDWAAPGKMPHHFLLVCGLLYN